MQNLKFVTNGFHPDDEFRISSMRTSDQTPLEAIKEYQEWASQFIIGSPQATNDFSSSDLEKMGSVGFYLPNASE